MAICLSAGAAALADDGSSALGTSPITKVVYSTTKSGSRLKWLPNRAEALASDTMQTQHAAQWTSASSSRISQLSAQSALDDPFGDKKADEAATITGPNTGGVLPNGSPYNNGMQYKPNNVLGPNNQGQTMEESLTAKHLDLSDVCPSEKDLKHISQLSTDITPSLGDLPRDCPWGGDDFQPRSWAPVTFTWTASGLCHKPLYFEDVQLERYGHMLGPWVQPFASGAHFFLTVPFLPYKMGLELPNECMYSLGYYRPGSCAPYMLDPIPLSIRAALFEAGAWVGGVAVIP
ncbi:MAG TPA: hypothetical protein VIH42_10340 [Thermoguttaceae bacterium]